MKENKISKGDMVVIAADSGGHLIPLGEEVMVQTIYPPAHYNNSKENYGVDYGGRTFIVDSEEIALKIKENATSR